MGEEHREILEALSDKTRYAILVALSRKPLTGDEIAEAVQRSRSTIEVHLAMLLRLGLVSRKKEEKKYYYETTQAARQWLGRLEPSNGIAQSIPVSAPIHQPLSHPQLTATKGSFRSLLWFYTALSAGVIYAVVHFILNYSGIVSYSIIPFAIALGVLYSWISDTLKEFSEALLVVAFAIGLLSQILVFGSISLFDWIVFFFIYMAALIILGIPTWIITKKVIMSLKG
jgi:DNA-binding transcriptional ArsR family regulator